MNLRSGRPTAPASATGAHRPSCARQNENREWTRAFRCKFEYLNGMRFTEDPSPNVNVIRGYGPGRLRINDEIFNTTMIVASNAIRAAPSITDAAKLSKEHTSLLLELGPEVVLIGTGRRQVFPGAAFGAQFLEAGIGLEAMDTGAACRTFNVLVGEQRNV